MLTRMSWRRPASGGRRWSDLPRVRSRAKCGVSRLDVENSGARSALVMRSRCDRSGILVVAARGGTVTAEAGLAGVGSGRAATAATRHDDEPLTAT